jgi:hypothetical protein
MATFGSFSQRMPLYNSQRVFSLSPHFENLPPKKEKKNIGCVICLHQNIYFFILFYFYFILFWPQMEDSIAERKQYPATNQRKSTPSVFQILAIAH